MSSKRLDACCDWSAVGATPQQRLEMLTARELRSAAWSNKAANVIELLLARTLGGDDPTDHHGHIAGLIADVWLANLAGIYQQAGNGHPSP